MNKKVTSIVSYCTILGWLVAYFAGDRDAKFHLNQGLVLGIFGTGIEVIFSVAGAIIGLIARIGGVIGFIFGLLGSLVSVLGWLIGLGVLVFIAIGVLNAINDRETKLPLIGGITILK